MGVAPLFVDEQRHLRLLGDGPSDYLDVLIEASHRPAGVSLLSCWLTEQQALWDVCEFESLRPGSALLEMPPPRPCRERTTPQAVCPALRLPHSPEGLRQVVPGSMMSKLGYYRRRLDRMNEARYECANSATLPELFEEFAAVHRARWEGRGQAGALAGPALWAFHREAALGLMNTEALRLYLLRQGGRLLAGVYGFKHGSRFSFYLSGFAPEYASLSPGVVLLGYTLQQAIREGARVFDFLRGSEAYKYQWGARDQVVYRRTIERENETADKQL